MMKKRNTKVNNKKRDNLKPVDHYKEIIPKIKIDNEGKNLLSEGINNIIHEYLIKRNLFETMEIFQKELLKIQENNPLNYDNKLIEFFNIGDMDNFFLIWSKYVPLSLRLKDVSTIEIEFFLNVFFCIYNKKKRDFSKFTDYLKLQGDELSKIDSLLPYFALPYAKNPENHPIFKTIFTNNWKIELKKKLVTFINTLYNIDTEPFLIHLYQFYLNNYQKNEVDVDKNNNTKSEKNIKNVKNVNIDVNKKEYVNYINELENNNSYLIEVVKHYNQKSNNDDNEIENLKIENENSIEIQKQWALFSEEILSLCNKIYKFSQNYINNEDKDILINFNSQILDFKNYLEINKQDLNKKEINKINSKINKMDDSNLIKINNMKESSSNKFKNNLDKSKEYLFIGIDFNKIKNDLLNGNKIIYILNLINQLLNKTVILRRIYIILIAKIDLFNLKNELEENELIKILLDDENRLSFLKCLNNICSDYEGRSYVIKSKNLLILIINILKKEKKDNSIKSHSLAIIQKISLRIERVQIMIENNIIELIISFLINYKDLNDYLLEYSIALLLNLSLRKEANKKFCEKKTDILKILFIILDNCNSTVRNFINGLIFSLINIKEIKEVAIELDIKSILEKNYDNIDEIFQKQINYIMKKIENNSIEENENIDYMQEYDSDNFNINDNNNENSIMNNSINSNFNENINIEDEYLLNNEDEKIQLNEIKPILNKNENKKNYLDSNDNNERPINRPTTPSMIKNSNGFNRKSKVELNNIYNSQNNPFNLNENEVINITNNNNIEDINLINDNDLIDDKIFEDNNKKGQNNDEWKKGFLPRPKIPRTPMVNVNDNINKI